MTSRRDEFAKLALGDQSARARNAFRPYARFDEDGDCVEFIALPHAYRGERIDECVTALYSMENGKLMGSLVKGVRKLLKRNPGWIIDLNDGEFHISQLLQAAEASRLDSPEPIRLTYFKLVALARESGTVARAEVAH